MTNHANCPVIQNDPTKAGRKVGKSEFYGEHSRYVVYPIHTRFLEVEWFVEDNEIIDWSGYPSIVGQESCRCFAIANVKGRTNV